VLWHKPCPTIPQYCLYRWSHHDCRIEQQEDNYNSRLNDDSICATRAIWLYGHYNLANLLNCIVKWHSISVCLLTVYCDHIETSIPNWFSSVVHSHIQDSFHHIYQKISEDTTFITKLFIAAGYIISDFA